MLNRFRQVVTNVIANGQEIQRRESKVDLDDPGHSGLPPKYKYNRPEFLQLTSEEITIASDCMMRPILVPRDLSKLPWYSGYAEVANAGKSKHNEDQAAASHFVLKGHHHETVITEKSTIETKATIEKATIEAMDPEAMDGTMSPDSEPDTDNKWRSSSYNLMAFVPSPEDISKQDPDDIPMTYFAIFDGHAGTGSALMTVNNLHYHILDKLDSIYELLIHSTAEQRHFSKKDDRRPHKWPFSANDMCVESLITGALETAFLDIDQLIAKEKTQYHISGGCTVLVALFVMGKLYLSNAGDSRAIIVKGKDHIPMSTDFTPILERQRLQRIAELSPHLLSDEFTHLEFQKRVQRKDLGKKLLYRDGNMVGWAYKEVTEDDLKFPLVYGEGKRARVLATIGVTRGFGDHELKVHGTNIFIKPFLSPAPEVKIYNVFEYDHSENDVLVMGSDGLWDILSSEKVAEICHEVLESFPPGDYKRYASAAQELAMAARGVLKENGWRTKDGKPGTGDDITVFVIPLCHHTGLSPQNSLTESNQAVPYIDDDDL